MPLSEYDLRLAIPHTAEGLLRQYGLLEQGWTFAWTDRLRASGLCSYREKEIRYSIHYLHVPVEAIVNTLRHEIAHALVGPGHHHDDVWRATARRIGCNGERCGNHISAVDHRWELRCEPCDLTWKRHRLASKHYKSRCPRCKGKLLITDNRD